MNVKKSGFLKMMLASLLVVILISACSKNNNDLAASSGPASPAGMDTPSAAPKAELPPVELTYYIPQAELQTDYASVETAINAYLKPKINATIKLMPVVFGDYDQKLNTIVTAGEAFDLAWTSNWSFPYEQNSVKGAFVDAEPLLKEYAPELMNSLPKVIIDSARNSQGKLFAIPNYQIAASNGGFVIQKELVDKYKLDVSKIKTYKDLEPFLAQIKANEPDKIPFLSRGNAFVKEMYGYDGTAEAAYKTGDPTFTLVDTIATPEYMAHHQLLHEWYLKGWVPQDVATASFDETIKTGKVAAMYEFTLKPGGEAESKIQNGGHDVVYIPTYEPRFTGVQTSMTAISKTSKNPERAMMFLNLANTDPVLFNMLAFGIEGKNYDKLDDKHIRIKPDGGYAPNVSWAMGNVTNGYLLEGQADDTWAKTIEINNTAIVPDLFGFQLNQEPIKTELANTQAVYKEYEMAVTTGAVDPAVYIPKMIEALKKAGSEKILQETQKQVDEFLKKKGLK